MVERLDFITTRVEFLGSTYDQLAAVKSHVTQLERRVSKIDQLEERLIKMEAANAKVTKTIDGCYHRMDGVEVQQNNQHLELTKKIQEVDEGMAQLRNEFYDKEENESQGGYFASPAHSESGQLDEGTQAPVGNIGNQHRGEKRPGSGTDVGAPRVSEARQPQQLPQGIPKDLH